MSRVFSLDLKTRTDFAGKRSTRIKNRKSAPV